MVKNKKDNSLLTIIFLSIIFTIILFLISLYFQNRQLKQFLISPTPRFTPTPSASPNPTISWQTYTVPLLKDYSGPLKITNGDYLRYQIKYPFNWQIVKNSSRPHPSEISLSCSPDTRLSLNLHPSPSEEISNLISQGYISDSIYISLLKGQKLSSSSNNPSTIFIYLKLDNQTLRIHLYNKSSDPLISQELDQILSTFKFLD